ncbi:SgcJ/EcaC family oxidoreductase [Leifsonia shinshuensis]|uniref:YybH family protein n=1 Tax=Leifsonia shinshuensis TaxID=150026 RepID=UPI002859E2CF|nr:SgcJ/EcaC family oxidoreductase [Leifsonia shinshuensis]MDR6971576.1 uncharacterized protein (TIGR02246 family) [Leifsonia shinshuensis]
MTDTSRIIEPALSAWADGIRAHDVERVAAQFTTDAVFQGFDRSHSVGRAAVAAYYAKQPVGLSPDYRVREVVELGEDAFLTFVDVDFARPGGEVIPTHLTIVFVRDGDEWLIRHYHVSKIDA